MTHFLLISIYCSIASLIVGYIWYHPKIMGKALQAASGITDQKIKSANMGLILGLVFLFNFMLSMAMHSAVIHQGGLGSMLQDVPAMKDKTSETFKAYEYLSSTYKMNFRSFKHGALHGFIMSLFFALPLIGTIGLYERKNSKYIFVHWGYWAIVLMLIGGIICQWSGL